MTLHEALKRHQFVAQWSNVLYCVDLCILYVVQYASKRATNATRPALLRRSTIALRGRFLLYFATVSIVYCALPKVMNSGFQSRYLLLAIIAASAQRENVLHTASALALSTPSVRAWARSETACPAATAVSISSASSLSIRSAALKNRTVLFFCSSAAFLILNHGENNKIRNVRFWFVHHGCL